MFKGKHYIQDWKFIHWAERLRTDKNLSIIRRLIVNKSESKVNLPVDPVFLSHC